MDGLSKKEIEIISALEFDKKYFFTSSDVDKFAKDKTQRYNIIKNLLNKKRIIKLNRYKYYLVPIKAKTGVWVEDSFIIIDELMDGKDYFIGDWAAANYWKLTDQIPMKIAVYTTRRQGRTQIMSTRIIFKRTTKMRINTSITKIIDTHQFKILSLEDSKKWLNSRE